MKNIFSALLFLLFVVTTFAQNIIRGPYLQMGTPESMIIRARTDLNLVLEVRYGTDRNNLSFAKSGTSGTEHVVEIKNLNPNTKYFYRLYSFGQPLSADDASFHFITSPTHGTEQPIHIWVIGDFGRANPPQIQVKETYLNQIKNNRHTDVWLWTGDNAYNDGTDTEYQNHVFEVYPEIFRNTVAWPTPGNHDYKSINAQHRGPYYDIFSLPTNGESGGLPSGEEGYYSFDYGNVHFVSLNSEWVPWYINPNSQMIQWLRNDLAATTQKWKVVYFHKPPYSKGSHDSDNVGDLIAMRTVLNPVIEEYGVDLVLNGHSHNYERTYLMKGHFDNSTTFDTDEHVVDNTCGSPAQGEAYIKYTDGDNANEGTVYCVIGNSGTNTTGKSLDHPAMCTNFQDEYGSLVIDVHGDTLTAKYVEMSGTVKDEFRILKRSTTSVTEPASFLKFIKVFPNPSTRMVQVAIQPEKPASMSVVVYDLNGKKVATLADKQFMNTAQVLEWNTSKVSKGNYLISISDGNRQESRLVVVE